MDANVDITSINDIAKVHNAWGFFDKLLACVIYSNSSNLVQKVDILYSNGRSIPPYIKTFTKPIAKSPKLHDEIEYDEYKDTNIYDLYTILLELLDNEKYNVYLPHWFYRYRCGGFGKTDILISKKEDNTNSIVIIKYGYENIILL